MATATPRCSSSHSLDTYLDRRTAYSFSLSSGGVRGDFYHSQDSENSGREAQFNPVWSRIGHGAIRHDRFDLPSPNDYGFALAAFASAVASARSSFGVSC